MSQEQDRVQIREVVTRRGLRWEPTCVVCGSQSWSGPERIDGLAYASRINGPDTLTTVAHYLVLSCGTCANTLTFDADMLDMLLDEGASAEGKR